MPLGYPTLSILIVAGDVRPEARRVADEDCIGARLQSPFEGVNAAAVPPVGAGIAAAGRDGIVDVEGDRQPLLAAETEQPQGIGVVVEHPQLDFPADLYAVNFDGSVLTGRWLRDGGGRVHSLE